MPKNDANPDGYSIYSTISLLRPGSVYEYEYAYGTKTGTTDEAGRCLVSAAKNQYNYILVTLGAPVKDKNGEYYDDWYSMVDALNLYKLYLVVDNENVRAIHVYSKLGFQAEGVLIHEFFANGAYHDATRMCIFQHEYRSLYGNDPTLPGDGPDPVR